MHNNQTPRTSNIHRLGLGALAALVLLTSACSTPPVDPGRRTGYDKERARLAQSVRGARMALAGEYSDDTGYCQRVMATRKFEAEVLSWGVTQVPWAQRQPSDVSISYRWSCKSIYTDKGGASAVGALLTLGAVPHLSTARLSLDVSISREGKSLFKGQYLEQREAADNLWADKSVARYVDMAEVLIEKFVKEVERDGALES